MEVKVHFRFNKTTGDVEIFDVTDTGNMRLSEAEHNREHDRIAAELGRVIERNPRVLEVLANDGAPAQEQALPDQKVEASIEDPENHKQRQKQVQ
jgi:hypothetical protein